MSAPFRVRDWLVQALGDLQAGRLDNARACCHAVLGLVPDEADALHLLGLAAHRAGSPAEAVAALARAVALRPDVAHFQANLGSVLLAAGDPAAAEPCFAAACARSPDAAGDLAGCRRLLGDAAAARGASAAAETWYRAALAVCPDHAPSLTNLGNLLAAGGRPDEAIALLDAAAALRPASADARHNLAAALLAAGRVVAAEGAARAAVHLDPGHADARYLLGSIQLLRGQWPEGFAGLEWRWRRRGFTCPRVFDRPHWDGGALAGRTLLLHAEQGLGDAIQMLRFVPAVAAGGRVLLEVPLALRRLAGRFAGMAEVFSAGEPGPPFDVQCPLPSLPWALGLTLAGIPGAPYLAPDAAGVAAWRERLSFLSGARVGLCWAGNPGYAADSRRSLAPERLSALAGLPGVAFVSLQPGAVAPPGLLLHDWTADLHDLADTAALLACLDLVVTVDTAVAHLAGALGRPVWLLNRFDTCWRWLLARDDSPWYPTLRIFRQDRPGDWDGVLARVRAELADYVSAAGDRDRRKAAIWNAVSPPP